ncbi:hypothetical protein AMAG_04992 [Allomyces macrogynus ATCC 38327]|uniref:Uncharacterized protein n=1 Tax=Allomyces macrogynus (strain ATCC 38327) TaxID=578462 RepID=A0A0L0S6X5_ALLM3|nr:hypothetical protein AMAG_04992 [Allomyces macrogynus ATCC 38327]|eukprot:KNE58180.1 hypothetical protein AMAG_04992 [Allomyces macrogynus ATCC 38327]
MDADVRPLVYRDNEPLTCTSDAADHARADVINHHQLPPPSSPSKIQVTHGSLTLPKNYHAATVAPTLSARPRLVRPSSRRAAAASSGGLRTVIRTGRSPARPSAMPHACASFTGSRPRSPSPAVTAPATPVNDDEESVISRVPATLNDDQDAPEEMATVAQLLAEARAQSLLAPADLDRFDAMADKNGLRDLPVDHATWLAMVAAMQRFDAPASAPATATGSINASAPSLDQSGPIDDVSQTDPDTPSTPTSPSSGGTWVTTSRASLPLADAADLDTGSTDAVVDDHHDPAWLTARLDRLPRQSCPPITKLGTAPTRTRRGSTSSRTTSPTRRVSTTSSGHSMPDLLAPSEDDQDPTTPEPPRRAPPPLRRRGTLAGPKPDPLTSTSDDDLVRRLESQLADRDRTIRSLRDRTRLLAAHYDRDAAHLADAEAAAKDLADALASARASAALARRDAIAAVAAEAAAAAERDKAVEALRRLEPQLTAVRGARDELRSAVEPLREQVAELEAERAALVEQVEELAAREGELVTQLEACQAELAVAQAVAAEHQHAATLLAGASLADEEEVPEAERSDVVQSAGLPMHEQVDESLGGSKASLSSAARKRASLCDELESADALFSSSSMARHSRVADTDEERAQMAARIEELAAVQERSEERAQMAARIDELVAVQEQSVHTIKDLEAQLDMARAAPPRIVDTGEEERAQMAARIAALLAAQEQSTGKIKDLETQLEMAHQVIQHLAATHMAATAATRPGSPTKPTAYSAPPTPARGLIQARPSTPAPLVRPQPVERAATPPNGLAEPELISATTTPVLGPANEPLTPSVSSSPVLTTITTPTLPPRDQPFAGAWPPLPRRNPLIATASTASLVRPVSPPAEAAHRRIGSVSSSTSSTAPLAATQATISVGGGSGASPTDHGVCPAAPAVPTGWRLVPLAHVSHDHTVPVDDDDEEDNDRSPSPSRVPLVRTPTVRSRASTATGSVAPVAAVTIAPKRPVVVFQGRLRRLNGWVRVGDVDRAAAPTQQAVGEDEEDDVSLGVDDDDDGYESAVESEAPRAVSPMPPVRRSRMAWLFGGWWAWY